jgi:hypothetical protein
MQIPHRLGPAPEDGQLPGQWRPPRLAAAAPRVRLGGTAFPDLCLHLEEIWAG